MAESMARGVAKRSAIPEILEDARDQRALIVVVEDDEVAAEPNALGVHAEQARAGGVEGADPHAARSAAGELLDALAHLARRLVGEGDGEDAIGPHATTEQLGDAEGDDARLARAGAGEDQKRPAGM